MQPSLFVYLTVVLLPLMQFTSAATFQGSGSSIPPQIFSQWFYSYQLLKSGVELSYNGAGTPAGTTDILARTVDFTSQNGPMDAVYQGSTFPPNDLFQFPILATPFVFAYNLPYGNMMSASDTSTNLQLILDRNTTAAIYAGLITNWRDPAILALQRPAVQSLLPNATIKLVVRYGGETVFVQQALYSFNPRLWRWGNISSLGIWTSAFLAQPNAVYTLYQWGATSAMQTIPNSLTYLPYPSVADQRNIKFASMINRRGELLNVPDLKDAFSSVVLDPDTLMPDKNVVDFDASGAWPLGCMQYNVFRARNFTSTCENRRQLLLFWKWAMTAQAPIVRARSLGFSTLTPESAQVVINAISKQLTCPSTYEPLLNFRALDQHSGFSFTALLIANSVCLVITIIVVVTYLIKDFHRSSFSAILYYLALFIGSILNYISVYFFWMVPSSATVCQARLWFASLGFAIMLSGIFSRAYQVRAVRNLAAAKGGQRKVSHSRIQVLGITVITSIQIILLLAWNQADKFKPTMDEVDDISLTFTWICATTAPKLWWGLEIAFALCLLGFGMHSVYLTWDLKHMVKESKWISITIYNCGVALMLVAVALSIMNPDDDTVHWIVGCVILFLTFLSVISFFLPRVLELRAIADVTTDDSSASRISSLPAPTNKEAPGTPHSGKADYPSTRPRSLTPTSQKFGSRLAPHGSAPVPQTLSVNVVKDCEQSTTGTPKGSMIIPTIALDAQPSRPEPSVSAV